jgi:hypothetical protein
MTEKCAVTRDKIIFFAGVIQISDYIELHIQDLAEVLWIFREMNVVCMQS